MARNEDCRYYTQSYDVVLKVGKKTFFLEKEILREGCVYFEAMFSGNFSEDSQQEVKIEIISADAMTFILDYLYYKSVEIYDLNTVGECIEASMFFQLPALVNLIVQNLIKKLDYLTWSKILYTAKIFNLSDLENKARCYCLYNFENIRKNIQCIDSISTLHWYLSHLYLNSSNEYQVFETGCDWLLQNKKEDKDILIILSCLNFYNLDKISLAKVVMNDLVQNHDVARQVVECIIQVLNQGISLECISLNIYSYLKNINKYIFDIAYGILLPVQDRKSIEQPCVIRKRNDSFLKRFDPKVNDLVNWLEISNKNWWGHNIVIWKGFNIILLYGETMGKSVWNTNIIMYSILEEKWSILNALPVTPRRHAAAVVHEDNLYTIGGVNSFRISLKSVTKYNLIDDTWQALPDLPEYCQNPVATFHKGELYVSAEMVYVLRNNEWVHLFKISTRHNRIISFKNSLYFAQNWRNSLSCWETDSVIEYMRPNERLSKNAKYNITSMCLIGKFIYFLTEPEHFEKQTYCLERCNLDKVTSLRTEVLIENIADSDYSYNTSECLAIPSLDIDDKSINDFGKRWLKNDDHITGIEVEIEPNCSTSDGIPFVSD